MGTDSSQMPLTDLELDIDDDPELFDDEWEQEEEEREETYYKVALRVNSKGSFLKSVLRLELTTEKI